MLTRPSSIFQIITWNWKHLTNVILHSYLGNALCTFFIKIEGSWCFSNKFWNQRHVTNQFTQRNCFVNASWKFLIKIESRWRREIKEQAPQLTLLYHGRTVRSSHRRCCISKLFLKILQYPQETTVLETIFSNVTSL